MTILKIARMGHPVLARRADPVADPTAPEIRKLAEDMIETMIDANGAGLAADQLPGVEGQAHRVGHGRAARAHRLLGARGGVDCGLVLDLGV